MVLILTLMLVTFPNTVSSSATDSDDGKCLPGSSECEMQSCRESMCMVPGGVPCSFISGHYYCAASHTYGMHLLIIISPSF